MQIAEEVLLGHMLDPLDRLPVKPIRCLKLLSVTMFHPQAVILYTRTPVKVEVP